MTILQFPRQPRMVETECPRPSRGAGVLVAGMIAGAIYVALICAAIAMAVAS